MDTASQEEKKYLPKEPLDLPKEPLDLPKPPLDLPLPEKELPPPTKPAASSPPSQQNMDDAQSGLKTLLAWSAPGRPFRKHGKQYFASILLITALIEIILFLFSMYLLMVVVASILFVVFALATVPPHPIHFRISTEGITIEDHSYLWMELYDFYIKPRNEENIIYVRTKSMYPGEFMLMPGDVHTEQIKNILIQYIPFREVVKPTFTEKSGAWLSKTFPLEKT